VALSFIFGNTIRNLFESMLFLFIQHPYDIGDWVEFDGKSYEVVKISLMNTVFHASGMIRTVIPNSTLIPKVRKGQRSALACGISH
jgi:small-conductance mechanosensitive channel